MKNSKKNRFVVSAVAGIALGASTPALRAADANEVKCYGINACGAHAKCSVAIEDLEAVRTLLGDQPYKERFGKSKTHSCGAHAKCGSESKILNWIPVSGDACKEQNGIVVEEVEGKKVAKKA